MHSLPRSSTVVRTADVADKLNDNVQIVEPGFLRSFGGLNAFRGLIETVVAPDDNVLLRQTLSEQGEGRVLVVNGLGSRQVALLGGNIASMAVHNGWSGCVIYGSVRDSQELATLPLGVFALGTCPRKSMKKGIGSRGQPVEILGVTMTPGSYLYADEDGIIVTAEMI
jgi:regulator of ribonuclease activity A